MSEATHICAICGALWRQFPDNSEGVPEGSWSLRSRKCGRCCDNAPMGMQIIPLSEVDAFADEVEIGRGESAALIYADRQAQAERAERCCGKCRHWRADAGAVVCDDGSKHPDGGWCKAPIYHTMPGPSPAMLSGDTCQAFEAAT